MKTQDIEFGLRGTADNIDYTKGFVFNEKNKGTTMEIQEPEYEELPTLSYYTEVIGLVEEEHFYCKNEKLLFTRVGIDYLIYTLNINVQLEVVNSVQSQCVIKATASFTESCLARSYQSLGSVNTTTYNVSESGNYMVEKAEQRAKCRAVLGLLGFKAMEGAYGSEEF